MLIYFLQSHFNTIGLIGVVMVLIAYLLLQIDKLSQDSITFSLANLVGSVLLLISLRYSWNLSSVVIEISWLFISFYGLCKAIYLRRRSKAS